MSPNDKKQKRVCGCKREFKNEESKKIYFSQKNKSKNI